MCLHFVWLPSLILAVDERVRWNPLCKQKLMTVEISASARSMCHSLHNYLKLGGYRRCVTTHWLLDLKRFIRLAVPLFCNDLRARNIETSSSQIRFFLSRKNWIVRITKCMHRAATKPWVICIHHPPFVMIWWGMSYHSTIQIHFCEQGVKTGKKVYCRMFEEIVELL